MERKHQGMWLFVFVAGWHVQQEGALSGKRIGNIASLGVLGGGIAQDDLRCPCAAYLCSDEGRENVSEPDQHDERDYKTLQEDSNWRSHMFRHQIHAG